MIPIQNQQHFLAEQFHAKDILLIKANYEVTLQIKRWKFIHSLSLGEKIIREADNMLYASVLSFVDNNDVLVDEGFFESDLAN